MSPPASPLPRPSDRPAWTFHGLTGALINTAALARCEDALSLGELFQQFVSRNEKPLKRLVARCSRLHRAKAAVLMRIVVLICETHRAGRLPLHGALARAATVIGLLATVGLDQIPLWRSSAVAGESTVLKLGLLLPPEAPESPSMREGVLLAKEQLNGSGTGQIEVIIRGRVGQWGADAVEAARMVSDDGVEGLLAPPDGAATHVALQVSGRTAVPVATLCADSSVGRTGVPWVLRIVPRTTDEAKALFTGLSPKTQSKHWLAVVSDGRSGRETSRDLTQAALGCKLRLEKVLESSRALSNEQSVCSQVVAGDADSVLLWLDPIAAGKMTRNLRRAGYRGILAGPGRLRCGDFATAAGDAVEGFVVPGILQSDQNAARWRSFESAYQKRWEHTPDLIAGMGYDAAVLFNYLLRQPEFQAPPHRIPANFSWHGVTGDFSFDSEGNRAAKLELLQAHNGQFSRPAKAN